MAARGHLVAVLARAQRQWRMLARLGGHFLDVVEGLTTLKVFGRARPQAEAIGRATDAHRAATMSVLRVAFVSALVLELAAALATALVAVGIGLRLLGGHIGYQVALLVLLPPTAGCGGRRMPAQPRAEPGAAARIRAQPTPGTSRKPSTRSAWMTMMSSGESAAHGGRTCR